MKRPVGVEKVTQRVCHAHGHGMDGSVCETSRSWIAGGGGRSARSVAASCPRTFSEGHFLRDAASRRPRDCFSQACLGGRLGPTGRRTARPWYSGFGLQRPHSRTAALWRCDASSISRSRHPCRACERFADQGCSVPAWIPRSEPFSPPLFGKHLTSQCEWQMAGTNTGTTIELHWALFPRYASFDLSVAERSQASEGIVPQHRPSGL